jgi:uncharacterized protein (TIGR03083 family)
LSLASGAGGPHASGVSAPDPALAVAAARTALRRVADEVVALVASAPDAAAVVPGSTWNVGDVSAHLALGTEAYLGYANGVTEAFFDLSDVAGGSLSRSSDARLQAEPERDPKALADRMQVAVTTLLAATEGRSADQHVIWHGEEIGLGAMLGLSLAEYMLHGRDIAKALRRPWTIRPDDARLVLASALPLLPILINPAATQHVRATYDLRVRGGARVDVAIHDGQMTVGPLGAAADCHVSADPVDLLLVAYGRKSQWGPVLTGKLVAWGRKPWLGPRLVSYLVAP